MASGKGILLGALGGLVLRDAVVLPRPADTRAYWSLGKVGLD